MSLNLTRQYSLPNCRLVLEGFNTEVGNGEQANQRPSLGVLLHAECHFAGMEQSLSGGKDFFETFVEAVTAYAQEFLSGIRHPVTAKETGDLISFSPVLDRHRYRLTWQPSKEEGKPTTPLHFDLTTLHLFDLVEAVDQFLADTQTLPEFSLKLQPVGRRYRKADIPVVQRVTPAFVGIGSLAAAAALLFLVPVPKVQLPDTPRPTETTSEQAPSTPASGPPPKELLEVLATAPQITDPTELYFLSRHLYRELNKAWQERGKVVQELIYKVSVSKDGSIIAYEPINNTPTGQDEGTPLPQLRYNPTQAEIARREEIADFKVVFTNRSVLQVNHWRGKISNYSYGPEITDGAILRRVNEQLINTLRPAWATVDYQLDKELIYRVGVTEDGVIADYEAQNQAAFDQEPQTPLPSLLKPEVAGIGKGQGTVVPQKPLGQFRVVFRSGKVVEVSPMRGF